MEVNFPKLEKKILNFWEKNKIFEKSILGRKGAKNFVFFEGPPTANGKPGIHHVLVRVFKDVICRYKTMRGFKVLRKAGWDAHGLPVELEVEKKLGLKNKKEIEKYGIAKFNKKCRESVWWYKKDWEKLTRRIGYWLDLENPYIIYQTEYMESVWWILKQIWTKGLLYQDYKVLPYCPRCGTSLSSHEVAQGYKKITEPAIFVRLRIKNPEFKNTSLLVWTTTPWTLPGNVAVAVNPDLTYVQLEVGQESLILAKERVADLKIEGRSLKEIKGKNLVGLSYESPYPLNEEVEKTAYKVISGDFVSLKEGTGLVHIAPAFGEEDMEAIKNENAKLRRQKTEQFPILVTVDEEGRFRLEVKKWAGLFVKDADPLIISDLRERGFLLKEEQYQHDYPFCWRCRTPLLYYAKKGWFIGMKKVKKELIENNEKINWVPGHLKEGRFGEWLREVKDWALSRERYWGTPLPIWQCQSCGTMEFIGSLADLLSQKFSTNNYLILRHGHSLRQLKDLASCWPEKNLCPLTKEGRNQVLKAAEKLKGKRIDLVFSSDLLRTKQTAEIISQKTGARLIFDKRLREFDVGIFNEKLPSLPWKFLEGKKDFMIAKIPKGESLSNMEKRMYGFLKEIDRHHRNKNILIVSHEFPLTILEKTLEGWSLEKILKWRAENREKTIKLAQVREIEFKELPLNEKRELDLHRPYIDLIKFSCPKCQGPMKKIPELIDCWFDSGSMPFAQYHYPFENKKIIGKNGQFPADFIAEAMDQTRGWFYTLLAISTLLEKGPPYKNVISPNLVLDEKGEKMSKSKGNVVDPWYIVDKFGADDTRWYFYTINQPGDPKLFSEKDIDQALKRFILTLWNSFSFFKTYGKKNKKPLAGSGAEKKSTGSQNILDKWIISKLQGLIKEVTNHLENYNVTFAARALEEFIIDDLSLWYIRRSRRRFQKPEKPEELLEASKTLSFVLLTFSKISSPFTPFLSEEIYQKISGQKESVHLENWPSWSEKGIDKEMDKKMEKAREIVTRALSERAKKGIKVRQPLAELQIAESDLKAEEELLTLIKEEVNVKNITFGKELKLDTEISASLREEGILREVIRQIQEMRKEAGFKPKDKILVGYSAEGETNNILAKNKEIILKEGNFKDFLSRDQIKSFDLEKEIKVGENKLWVAIKKI